MIVDSTQLLESSSVAGLTTQQRDAIYLSLTQSLMECFLAEDSVAIPGFGTLVPEKKAECLATDPTTGKRMLYPPHIRLTYQPSVILRKKITG